ncbi:hypothetical protein N7468_000379 [Penicillium chermesinum]|uniref:Uncharacterized protein n=1 Tax=Penicillium chermesinum TaxID=63820 RepID=A0A9W9TYA9_9EURO|nr:uncharacterized protein N7468_000379 [Penicillium chermesinum]KAJ5248928.1 hypothetical protein N7468_000379 [Penicillium chermesinum]
MWPTRATSKRGRRGSNSTSGRVPPPGKEIKVPLPVPPPDPNMSDPRLLINRPCIYERRLPSDAHVAAYVQRLQHGFYANDAVSDMDSDHVDFLGITFVFHSAQSLNHRFKSAVIRASVADGSDGTQNTYSAYLMLMTCGVSEGPVNASIIPSGGLNGRYNRYEMMRIQGSARTRKSPRGRAFDIESGEVVWSLEENSLDRTGLPREFTFVMLVQKPAVDSKVSLDINIEPVLQSRVGSYPNWMLALPAYQPIRRNHVDFNKEIGQRFTPAIPGRGFNFAGLKSAFEDYMAMPGRHHSRSIEIPASNSTQFNGYSPGSQGNQGYQAGWGFNPANLLSSNGTSFSAAAVPGDVLRAELGSLPIGIQGSNSQTAPQTSNTTGQPQSGGNTMNLNIRIENPALNTPHHHQWRSPVATVEDDDSNEVLSESSVEEEYKENENEGWLASLRLEDSERARMVAGKCYEEEEKQRSPSLPPLSTRDASHRVMSMANVPVTHSMLSSLAGTRQSWVQPDRRSVHLGAKTREEQPKENHYMARERRK